MRKTMVVLATIGMLLVAATGASAAPAYQKVCRDGGGAETSDNSWLENAPYLISISRSTVLSINARVGLHDGQPGTWPRYIPCVVAESVANNGLHAWRWNWPANEGWMGAGWMGAATGPYFGPFDCRGVALATNEVDERCDHAADRHTGRISVIFVIQHV